MALEDFVHRPDKPRTVWVMLPAGKITEATIDALAKLLAPDYVIIDGGNTFWQDDVRHAKALRERDIHYVDVVTSGRVWGFERGYCMMIGSDKASVDRLDPIFASVAPSRGDIPQTRAGMAVIPRRARKHSLRPRLGGAFRQDGAQRHRVGLMQAYAEGFDILKNANVDALPVEHRFKLDFVEMGIDDDSPLSGPFRTFLAVWRMHSRRQNAVVGTEATLSIGTKRSQDG